MGRVQTPFGSSDKGLQTPFGSSDKGLLRQKWQRKSGASVLTSKKTLDVHSKL
jgi:hypothetical protein